MDRAASVLGVDTIAMADAAEIREVVGWSIGGVPPFCHETDVPTLLDESLSEYEQIWAAAGTPQAVFRLTPETLARLTDGRWAVIAEG
jgi:prolyl-tRNA editing enzyme YbaK/EbsC (Cys-tRNA(Pro) deacylase)